MLKHLIIGAIIASVMFQFGVVTGIYAALLLAFLDNLSIYLGRPKVVPVKTLELLEPGKVHKHAENVIGYYLDNPIHEYVEMKNPANGNIQRYDYFDIIPFNTLGQIMRPPADDEIFLNTKMIYKIKAAEPK